MKRYVFAALLAAATLLTPSVASAHEYDRDDSDYPLRVAAYAVYPIGIAAEYLVMRPIHWLVSYNKCTQIVFGHEVLPGEPENKFEWK
jgi:hypothetical protein